MTSHSSEWTASDIASYDQSLAAADLRAHTLALALRIGAVQVGERQSMANITLLMLTDYSKEELAGLLIAVLRRQAE
jgi:hypothetical protein